MPDETADVGVQGVEAVGLAVAMQTHAFGHADGGADEDGVGAGDFLSA